MSEKHHVEIVHVLEEIYSALGWIALWLCGVVIIAVLGLFK